MYTVSCKVNNGAINTPPRPASIIVITQATEDVRAALTPRSPANDSRSTTARISRPTRVRRITYHNTIAASAATTNTAIWSELSTTSGEAVVVVRRRGADPRTGTPFVVASLP